MLGRERDEGQALSEVKLKLSRRQNTHAHTHLPVGKLEHL